MPSQRTDDLSHAHFTGPVGRTSRGQVHEVDAGDQKDENGDDGENVHILDGPRHSVVSEIRMQMHPCDRIQLQIGQTLRKFGANEAVYLPKYTTLAYFIGVPEFFGAMKLVVSRTFQALAVYAIGAIIFLILISIITWLLNLIHERTKIPGL